MEKAWDKTETKPDNERFVILILQDGTEREAQYSKARHNPFRHGKDWLTRDGKYAAVGFNPAIAWREI